MWVNLRKLPVRIQDYLNLEGIKKTKKMLRIVKLFSSLMMMPSWLCMTASLIMTGSSREQLLDKWLMSLIFGRTRVTSSKQCLTNLERRWSFRTPTSVTKTYSWITWKLSWIFHVRLIIFATKIHCNRITYSSWDKLLRVIYWKQCSKVT